jgi:hypothetical protein
VYRGSSVAYYFHPIDYFYSTHSTLLYSTLSITRVLMSSFGDNSTRQSSFDRTDTLSFVSIDPAEVLLEGYLTKEGGGWKSWKRRYFILSFGGILNYYEDETLHKPKGSLDCSTSFSLRMLPEVGQYYFEIDSELVSTKSERKLRLKADDEPTMNEWSASFQLLQLKLRQGVLMTGDAGEGEKADTYMKGYLTKEGGSWKTWKRRYFVLKKNGIMNYYEDKSMSKLKGTLAVKDSEVHLFPEEGDLAFEIVSDIFGEGSGRSLKVRADDDEQLESWVKAVRVISCMYGDKDDKIDKPAELASLGKAPSGSIDGAEGGEVDAETQAELDAEAAAVAAQLKRLSEPLARMEGDRKMSVT